MIGPAGAAGPVLSPREDSKCRLKRIHLELVAATLTAGIGLLAATGSLDLGVGSGKALARNLVIFPFMCGTDLCSLRASPPPHRRFSHSDGTEKSAVRSSWRPNGGRRPPPPFSCRWRFLRLVVAIQFLGLYVGSALYLFYVSWRQGKYHPLAAVSLGLGFAGALYLIFEIVFQIPLHKGPLENMFGVYS